MERLIPDEAIAIAHRILHDNQAVVFRVDAKQEALDVGLSRVRVAIDASERKGRLDAEQAGAARGRVQGSLTLASVSAADLVIEAVFENLAVKREVFGRLGQLAKAGAVLATNTSTLDVDAIAAASGRPSDVVGMHFFSPANVMRLVEIVRGSDSSRSTGRSRPSAMSGSTPTRWMGLPSGRENTSVVIRRRPAPVTSSMYSCAQPLPNVRRPRTGARVGSCCGSRSEAAATSRCTSGSRR